MHVFSSEDKRAANAKWNRVGEEMGSPSPEIVEGLRSKTPLHISSGEDEPEKAGVATTDCIKSVQIV